MLENLNPMNTSTTISSSLLLRRPSISLSKPFSLISNNDSSLLLTPPDPALDRTGIHPTNPLLQRLFDKFGSSPRHVYGVFMWAHRHPGYVSSVGVFNAVVKVFCRAKEFKPALCLVFDRLKRVGTEDGPDVDTFAILVRRFARAGLPSLAVKSLEFARSLNLMQSPITGLNLIEVLLDSFCKEGLVPEASQYFENNRIRDPYWVPSIHVYNTILSGWFRERQLERVNWFLDEMEKNKIKRTVVIYSTLAEGYCSISHVEVAIELVRQMKDEGIEPNAFIFNPIIDTLGKLGRFTEALGILERFQVLESGPTFSTYDSLVKNFCKAGDIEGANKIIKMMIGRGFIPTATTYSYLFKYFSNAEMTEEGLNLYVKMIESGYSPDRISCLILVKMLCKEERLDLVMKIRKEMKSWGYDLDLYSYTMLVHFLCDAYRLEEALGELKEMIDLGFVPRHFTCLKLLDELKKHGSTEKGRDLSDIVSSVPHLTMLQKISGREDYASRVRRRAIIGKAKAMSDTLKVCRNPRKLVKKRRDWKSVGE